MKVNLREYVREFSVAGAAAALFVVMALALLVPVSWPESPSTIPVYNPNATSEGGIANALFEGFPVTVILIAILLGAAMIGGVYLAKMDEPGKVGP